MAITTSDELKKQLTVIFGSKTGLITPEIEVGDIIGIGNLSNQRTEILIKKTLNFLYAYNALLQDLGGSKLHSIEFDLINLDTSNEALQLMPKSMLLIPGEFKDCITILLILSPEMSLLDNKKAKNAVDNLGKLYFEVEEAINRPEINTSHKKAILNKFAHRFALKMQGNVIEGKWQKKLVGIKNESNDKDFQNYINVTMDKEINWKEKQFNPKKYRFKKINLDFDDKEQFEFNKIGLLPSTFELILKNSLKISSNLFKIANTGTVDDVQNQFLITILSKMQNEFPTVSEEIPMSQLAIIFKENLNKIKKSLVDYNKILSRFCKSGRVGSLNDILIQLNEDVKNNIKNFDKYSQDFLININKVELGQLEIGNYDSNEKVRSMEFKPILMYLKENMKLVLRSIDKTLPQFVYIYYLLNYSKQLIKLIYKEFESQRKPVKELGLKFLKKYALFLRNAIDELSFYDEDKSINSYKKSKEMAKEIIKSFTQDVFIEIKDLLGFVEIMHENDPNLLMHINKLKTYPDEIQFLWGIMLRYSTFQQFLKNLECEELTPAVFIDNFTEFLKRRLSAFSLNWIHIIFNWMDDFKRRYQPKYEMDKKDDKKWSESKIILEFLDYFEKRVEKTKDIISFKIPLDQYIKSQMMDFKNKNLKEVLKSYNMSLELIEQIPDYIYQVFLKVIAEIPQNDFEDSISNYLGDFPSIKMVFNDFKEKINQMELQSLKSPQETVQKKTFIEEIEQIFKIYGFYEFILEKDLKYFSKLFPQPKTIILKNSDLDHSSPYHNLTQIIEFQYLNRIMRGSLSVDMKKVKKIFTNTIREKI